MINQFIGAQNMTHLQNLKDDFSSGRLHNTDDGSALLGQLFAMTSSVACIVLTYKYVCVCKRIYVYYH